MAQSNLPGFLVFLGLVLTLLMVFLATLTGVVLSQSKSSQVSFAMLGQQASSLMAAGEPSIAPAPGSDTATDADEAGSNSRQPLSLLAERAAELHERGAARREADEAARPLLRPLSEQGVYYAHFSKSGGTTLKTVLKQYLATQQLSWCGNKQPGAAQRVPGPMEICGSHDYSDALLRSVDARLAHAGFTTVILVRDPIDRLLSEYAWFYRYKGHLGGSGASDPFFRYQELAASVQDALRTQVMDDLLRQLDAGDSTTLCGYLSQQPGTIKPPKCGPAEYDRALQMLLSYDLVLITEQFDESLALLARGLRFPNSAAELAGNGSLHYVKRKVISKSIRKADLPADFVDKLHERLRYDYRLYRLALKLNAGMLQHVRSFDPDFDDLLDAFVQRQAVIAQTEHCRQDDTATFNTCL